MSLGNKPTNMQEPGQTKGTANMTGSPINLNVFKEHASNQLMGILDGVSKKQQNTNNC